MQNGHDNSIRHRPSHDSHLQQAQTFFLLKYSYPKTTGSIIDIFKDETALKISLKDEAIIVLFIISARNGTCFFKMAFSPTQPKLCTASGDDWYVLSMRWWDLWRDYTLFVTWTDKPILPRKLTHGSPETCPPETEKELKINPNHQFFWGFKMVVFGGIHLWF